ncbi:MAG TPA: protein phosphatase 2C domain-containing protein, partial [Gemmatimonadales bacterium]|nr:protein phosphatase 2C domain-containing protein [Gemmatimonadales bacterium]
MAVAELRTTGVSTGAKPRDEELDLFGLTHPGKVRAENQDHFLLCTVHPQVVVHGTSLPDPDSLPLRGQRLATLMLVADGVGGSSSGGEASQLAVQSITRFVADSLRCYHTAGTSGEEEFLTALRVAALEAHKAVKEAALADAKKRATTLTLGIFVWPWLYVVQVGDSRCYYYWQGELKQVTRDQTMAQDLVARGALPAERAASSPFSN